MTRIVYPLVVAIVLGCASYDPVTMDRPDGDLAHPARLDGIAFESAGARVNAIAYLAAGEGPHPTAILLHGFPGYERNLDLAQALRRAGWNVVFFHYRGAWGSGGAFRFTHAVEDVGAVVAAVRSPAFAAAHRVDPLRVALVGHSMGGFAALTAAARSPEVECVVSLAGANLALLASAPEDQRSEVVAMIASWLGPIRGATADDLVAEVLSDPGAFDVRARAPALANRPLLLVAATRDVATPKEAHHDPMVEALRAAGADRLTTAVFDTDHAFSGRRIALARTVVGWMDEHCR